MIGSELRYISRSLVKAPAFTMAAVITLALGIGANATMFGIVDRLLLRPPAHVRDPEGLVRIGAEWTRRATGEPGEPFFYFSYPSYKALRDDSRAFGAVAVSTTPDGFPIGRGINASRATGMLVSANYFSTLGVTPALGRFFLPEEDVEPVGVPVAVISDAFWRRHFAGDDAVIGRTLDLGTRRFTVVGVAPRGFTGLWLGENDVWLPITAGEGLRFLGGDWAENRGATWVHIFARVRDEAAPDQLAAAATLAYRASLPPSRLEQGEPGLLLLPVKSAWVNDRGDAKDDTRVAALLAGVAGLVLLIACANVANLMLARALRRRREIAVRLALGIERRRLVMELMTESLVLALLGGIAAILVARWGGDVVRTAFFGDVIWTESLVDDRVIMFAALATLLTALLAGLIPAVQASRPDLAAALKAGTREGGGQRSRTRATLLVVQATLAAVLLVGTGLFVRSLHNVTAVPMGMHPERVLLSSLSLKGAGYTPAQMNDVFTRMSDAARALPGVQHAAVSLTVPFASSWGARIVVPGRDSVPGAAVNAVSPGFFTTMGTRLLTGRDFSTLDAANGTGMVISARASRRWFPAGDALGRCVHVGSDTAPCVEVIGVVEDMRKETVLAPEDDVLQVYIPLARATASMAQRLLLVRPAGTDIAALIEPVRRAVQGAAPNLPYVEVRPLTDLLEAEIRPWRLGATMFTAFGLVALLLTCVGIYGVVSYSAAQRTREMGVRIALGARTGSLLSAVAREGMLLSLQGAAIGVAIALLLQRVVEPLLFEVSPLDPLVLAGVVLALVVIAALGSMVPAWRATRVDPVVALRSE